MVDRREIRDPDRRESRAATVANLATNPKGISHAPGEPTSPLGGGAILTTPDGRYLTPDEEHILRKAEEQ